MTDGTTPRPELNCLDGRAAPPEIVDGWKMLQGLPETALKSIWDLIAPMLVEPNQPEHQQRIQQFATMHGADALDVLAAVSSAGVIVERARSIKLPPDKLAEDALRMSGGQEDEASRQISGGYAKFLDELQQHAMQRTLALHGNLLVGLDWRIDTVESSNVAGKVDERVMFMTLSYLANEEPKRLSLQVTPEVMGHLRTFVDQFTNE